MSRPQEEQRPLFPFGNPFRVILPKGSRLPQRLLSLLNAFEETLSVRLQKLMPKDNDDVLSLSWMKLAMDSLSDMHKDIKTLITDLELSVSDWDEKWIDAYLDISVKLLDICIAFISELTRLNQGNLLLQCILHKLEAKSTEKFVQARFSIDSWRQHIGSKNPRIGAVPTILNGLVDSLSLPKVKNSSKGKVLMRAMYGVKVVTVYICSVFYAAFCGSSKNLLDLTVSDPVLWARAFSDLQETMNGEIRTIFSTGNFTLVKELNAVESGVKILYPMIQDGLGPIQDQVFMNSVSDLGRTAEKLSQGFVLVSKEVDGFFKIVLTGRDALLGNLRAGGAISDSLSWKNAKEHVAR